MADIFENNLILFLSSLVIGVIAWVFSSRISSVRVRRAAKGTIIYLLFPVVYLGHPFLYYQCWMLLLIYITEMKLSWLLLFMLIWGVFIALSQIKIKKAL